MDTVDFVPLDGPDEIGDRDTPEEGGEAPCRVRRQWTAEALRAHLRRGEHAWREGDTLTFAVEAHADRMVLAGGLQLPLSPVRGTALWVATVRVPDIEAALVSYHFVPQGTNNPSEPAVWRGPEALPPPRRSSPLRGHVSTDTLRSRFLGAPREVTVYAPPGVDRSGADGVVYMGDGESIGELAPIVDWLVDAGRLPRVLLVGVHSAMDGGEEGPPGAGRALEYLHDFGEAFGGDDSRFQAHRHFFAEELVAWAEARWKTPRRRAKRAVFGISNAGAMAIQQGLRHPDRFARVIAFSPAGHVPEKIRARRRRHVPSFLLSAGRLEPSILRTAREWKVLLEGGGFPVRLEEPVAGHDAASWTAQLGPALEWAFRE